MCTDTLKYFLAFHRLAGSPCRHENTGQSSSKNTSSQKEQNIPTKQSLVTFLVTMQLFSHILPLVWSCGFPLSWLLSAIFMPQSAPWCSTFVEIALSSKLPFLVIWVENQCPGDHIDYTATSLIVWWELWLVKGSLVWKVRMEKKERQQEQRINNSVCFLPFVCDMQPPPPLQRTQGPVHLSVLLP